MTQRSDDRTVKMGMLLGFLGTIVVFISFYSFLPQVAEEVSLVERLKLGIMCLVFPVTLFFLMIVRVGSQRFGNLSADPTKCEANTEGMKVDLRVLSNTHEQLMIFAINILALSALMPYQFLSLLPIYSGVFVAGRVMFWVGYRRNVLWRAPGFAMSTLPAVIGVGYSCVAVLLAAFESV
ncbi:MAPEG family protein [Halomonas sp. GT]|uniref:MAPEG family protein n=1 Tax=Halomonas sp. GT TaxID=1971364 RepID=UPI0009F273AE|nr:MAPEG family protein [Halomonas sp. GT]